MTVDTSRQGIAQGAARGVAGEMRVRQRIGIYDVCNAPCGLTKYVDALLSGIDLDTYEVVVFCLQNGPYRPLPGIQYVYLPHEAGGGSIARNRRRGFAPSLRAAARFGWRRFSPPAWKLWAGFGRECLKLSRVFRRWPVDLLHTQIVCSEASAVGARLAGVPRVLGTFHIDSARSRARDWVLEYITNHCLDRAIAMSEATRVDWVRHTRLPGDRVITIPTAVDTQKCRRRCKPAEARSQLGLPTDDRVVIGAVGRLAEQKGYPYLLEAVALLSDDYPDLTVALAGDGPSRPSLIEQARSLKIADRVHFLGFRADVQPVLDASDIFALPSLWEALPLALLEAMATGLPVVGTTVAGVPEVIVPGETGYLVPPRDIRAFAESLRPLLDSRDLRQRMGQAGRERVIRFYNEASSLRQIFDLYGEMLRP